MDFLCRPIVAFASIVLIFTVVIVAETEAEHKHAAQTSTPHGPAHSTDGGLWQRTYYMPWTGGEPEIKVTGDEWTVLTQTPRTNLTCDPTEETLAYTSTQTHSVSTSVGVDVSGAAEWAAGALFTKLKFTAGVRVSGSRVWGETKSVSVAVTSKTSLGPCKSKQCTFKDRKVQCVGKIDSWDCMFACQCVKCGTESRGYCNRETITGEATGWMQTATEWSDLPAPSNCSTCMPMPPSTSPTPDTPPTTPTLPPTPPPTTPPTAPPQTPPTAPPTSQILPL